MNPAAKKWVRALVRVGMGALWAYSSFHKLRDPEAFSDAVYRYSILPRSIIPAFSNAIPVLEFAVGGMLLLKINPRVAAKTSVLLLAIFLAALIQAHARNLKIDCGCFGSNFDLPASLGAAIGRDVFLLLAAGWLATAEASERRG